MTRDGQRFLMVKDQAPEATEINVVVTLVRGAEAAGAYPMTGSVVRDADFGLGSWSALANAAAARQLPVHRPATET